jgi:hypothetical protein
MIIEFLWDKDFNNGGGNPDGRYRMVKHALDYGFGDADISSGPALSTNKIGQDFFTHRKYAFWYGGNNLSGYVGSTTIFPRNSVIFPNEAILIGTGDLGTTTPAATMSFGLDTPNDSASVFSGLTPNVAFTTIDPNVNDASEVFFYAKPMSEYGYGASGTGDPIYDNGAGFIQRGDTQIGIIKLASPAMPVRRITGLTADTTGNHLLLVPYIVQGATVAGGDNAVAPGENNGGVPGAPDLYINTAGSLGGGGGTSGTSGTSGASGNTWQFGAGAPATGVVGNNPGDIYVDTTNGDLYVWNGTDWVSSGDSIYGTNGTSGTSPCCKEPEFIAWENGQLVDYAKTSGVDKPVIYFYDEFSAYDSPGVMTDGDIVLTLDPNLANTVDCPGKRDWKLIFPEYQRVEDGRSWTVRQDGTGVNPVDLVQYQSGIVTPHVLEFFWDENYYLCNPVDISFAIDNSGSIQDPPEWGLMFDGIIEASSLTF